MGRRHPITALVLLASCSWQASPDGFTEQDLALIAAMVLPERSPADTGNAAAVALGKSLFFDKGLSNAIAVSHADQVMPLTAVACSDCHAPRAWWSDERSSPNNVSLGTRWTPRNSPSLVNVGFYQAWAWDGRSDSLWMQCAVAYEAGATQAGTRSKLAAELFARYDAGYLAAFGEHVPPNPDAGAELNHIAANGYKAMAAYLAKLVSRDSPFDRYASGDRAALSDAQKRGLALFIGKAGCVQCHSGQMFTDNQYHSVGIGQRGPHVPATDYGREAGLSFRATHDFNACRPGCELPSDAGVGLFRTKSLRQVAVTPPYMHAGQLATLAEVVRFYNEGGESAGFVGQKSPQMVPLGLTPAEEDDLVAFLEALTGRGVAQELWP